MGDIQRLHSSPRSLMNGRAAVTAVLLSLFFIVVYGGTNWLTAQRPAVQIGTWYLGWELALVPFISVLIIPYMSIDLFFFAAPFLCASDRERKVFVKRVVFSISVATAFFLFMPLKLVWPARPAISGWFGELVEALCTAPFLMEYPHNLFPSLHVALCTILADTYGRHTRGLLKLLLQIWFFFIAISTMLTWQHHFVDLAGGLMLAGFAFYLFPESSHRLAGQTNQRIGSYYAFGGVALLGIAPLFWPWGVFLLWPATSLLIVAWAYSGNGAGIFRKTDGCLPLSTRFVMAFVLLGHYLSWRYYRRHNRAFDRVSPRVLIGGRLSGSEAEALVEQGVTAILDLTSEFSESSILLKMNYLNVPILDLTSPTQEQLQKAVAFISNNVRHTQVYVHCKIGYSRTAAVVGAYLLASDESTNVRKAVERLQETRPSIIIRPEAMAALFEFEKRRKTVRVITQFSRLVQSTAA